MLRASVSLVEKPVTYFGNALSRKAKWKGHPGRKLAATVEKKVTNPVIAPTTAQAAKEAIPQGSARLVPSLAIYVKAPTMYLPSAP